MSLFSPPPRSSHPPDETQTQHKQGDFKAWLKATQTGQKKTWADPTRHEWSTLSEYVSNVLAADADDGRE
jgi:hypothetical protein